MKNIMKKPIMILTTCVLTLLIGTGIFCNFNFNKDNVQTATTPYDNLDTTKYEVAFPYNNPNSTNGVRIDGWRALALRFRPSAKTLTLISVGLI